MLKIKSKAPEGVACAAAGMLLLAALNPAAAAPQYGAWGFDLTAMDKSVAEDYLRRQVVSDPHSPRAFRVIGPTRNIDAWYAAFGVKPGDGYYIDAADRVRIW
jgi:Peptidase family M13